MDEKYNYFILFCKGVFGKAYDDIVISEGKNITLLFEGNKIKNATEDEIIEAINLNSKINIIKLNEKSKDAEKFLYKDGYVYKINFSNGTLYEKYIKEVINKCALIDTAIG